MSVAVAIPSAITYGVADFTGGLAARRAPVLLVTALIQTAGLVVLVPSTLLVGGVPSAPALIVGAGAGIAGATGLLLYLRGLAVGPMGVIAPLSAVVGAGLPLVVGVLAGERIGPVAIAAIAVALGAILLAQVGTRRDPAAATGVLLGLGAGVGFGLFFVGVDLAPDDSGLWPLLAGRTASVTLLAVLATARRGSRRFGAGGAPIRLMIVSGVGDTLANVLFLVAVRLGDLGVNAVVVSLYPVVVVLLARAVLKEQLTRTQLASAGMALGASVLLAAAG